MGVNVHYGVVDSGLMGLVHFGMIRKVESGLMGFTDVNRACQR